MAPKRSAPDDAEQGESGWSSNTVTELKAELKSRGLHVGGKKADLLARLETHDNEQHDMPPSNLVAQPNVAVDANATGEDEDEEEDRPNYNNLTVPELKSEIQTRGLSSTGKKADLVARLEAHDNGEAVDLAPAPAPKAKRAKKAASPDPEIEGPLAAEVIVNQESHLETGERRLREFVPAPDDKFKDKLKRIRKERMFMLDRTMGFDRDHQRCETFIIAGSTGNLYTTTIGRSPRCTCMDARTRGQKCKHINYALIIILKAPVYLQYQLAFLSDELQSIWANAPVTQDPNLEHNLQEADESTYNGSRKPIEGECPICVFDMEPEEELVWCKAACGQNFHKECFEQWRHSKQGGRVTCVYCRTEWQEDGVKNPVPGSLASLKDTAPKIGSYQNIGHHAMYQQPMNE